MRGAPRLCCRAPPLPPPPRLSPPALFGRARSCVWVPVSLTGCLTAAAARGPRPRRHDHCTGRAHGLLVRGQVRVRAGAAAGGGLLPRGLWRGRHLRRAQPHDQALQIRGGGARARAPRRGEGCVRGGGGGVGIAMCTPRKALSPGPDPAPQLDQRRAGRGACRGCRRCG
jgi:hypothetical protein